MHLTHIALDHLSIATTNMRHQRRAPDVSDLLPSVRARGILVPLLVRPAADEGSDTPEAYGIVAGRRRYFAAKIVATETGTTPEIPCAVMEPGDDADAIEASLIENLARRDPDEMTQYETFVKLVKQGRDVAEIAATFGLTETAVKQRLALGNLLPKIREAYRRDEIEADTVRHLTLASKAQQTEWLALLEDPESFAPRGQQLKAWLFGGQSIAASAALFPLDSYPGQIVTDLFGEGGYFADSDLFWQHQKAAIAERRETYLAKGWPDVVVLEPGQSFHLWDHEKTPKRKGGKVYIQITARGEVAIHEGYLSRQEAQKARRKASGEAEETQPARARPERPEKSAALQTYLDLHRHAAVRTRLLDHPQIALRLMLAHAVSGSFLWKVEPEPQRAGRDDIAQSLAASPAQAAFASRRAALRTLLGLSEDEGAIAGHGTADIEAVFTALLEVSDEDVLRVAACIMAETLAVGTPLIDVLGQHLSVDLRAVWQPDDTFFELLRDKRVTRAMLAEVAGDTVAQGNQAATLSVHKQVIRDCLDGRNGRAAEPDWLPRWLEFPARNYL
ncbi:ParB N-terminal domain-containing protein [Ferrovibrio sp.]|uniref:ParB/RepB/Spo0J family partition protein n=1 Tax=Ferrovibrio sp. TaxID=1917215 RepID=UPI00311E8350